MTVSECVLVQVQSEQAINDSEREEPSNEMEPEDESVWECMFEFISSVLLVGCRAERYGQASKH